MSETIRSFIAIELSPENQTKLSQIIQELKTSGADVKWVKAENIHLTLKFLGNVEQAQIEAINEILQETAGEFEKFEFQLNELGAFPRIQSPRVIWVNAQAQEGIIGKIVLKLEGSLEKLGFAKEEREFTPHITIGRVRSSRGRMQLADKLKQINPFDIPRAKARGLLRIDTESGVCCPRPEGRGLDAAERIKISSAIIQEVNKLTLFKSTLAPSGPIYEILKEASLK